MTIRSFLVLMLWIAASPAFAQGVVMDKSQIRFVSRQMGVSVEGAFRKWKADVAFPRNDLARAKIVVEVDTASVELPSAEADAEVRGPTWFDSGKFPVARFVSSSVKGVGGDNYEVAGTFTLKGISRDIVVPVVVKGDVAEASFSVKRLDHKIGAGGEWADTDVVANDVAVRVRMTLSPGR